MVLYKNNPPFIMIKFDILILFQNNNEILLENRFFFQND